MYMHYFSLCIETVENCILDSGTGQADSVCFPLMSGRDPGLDTPGREGVQTAYRAGYVITVINQSQTALTL